MRVPDEAPFMHRPRPLADGPSCRHCRPPHAFMPRLYRVGRKSAAPSAILLGAILPHLMPRPRDIPVNGGRRCAFPLYNTASMAATEDRMELFIFARFHAAEGRAEEV